MLVMEDLSDDDSSYSNSTYSSFCFWSIEACGESPYSCTWIMDTSIWSSDSICSDSSYRSICSSKTYSADSLCTSTVSTDTFSDSSSSFMWSVTSLEGNWLPNWDFDIQGQGDFVASKEEEFDGTNNICVSLIKLSHHIIQIQIVFSLKLNILLSYLWWNKKRKYNYHNITIYFF